MESGNATTPTPAPAPAPAPAPVPAPKTSRIRFDASYSYSIGGLLKISQVIINLIGLILIQTSGENAQLSRAVYYSFVAGMGLCITSILLFLYFLHLIQVMTFVPWFKVELGYCLLWILFHLIAGFLTVGLVHGNFDAAGYFAFAAVVAYALEAFYTVCRITVRRG